MSQLGASNLNLNLNLGTSNLNLAAGGASLGAASRGTRINSQEFRKVIARDEFPFRADGGAARATIDRIVYPEFWDGELQSYLYLDEFTARNQNWLPELTRELTGQAHELFKHIDEQLVAVVDAAPERESRFAEIVQQDSADGALSYWIGMLALDIGHAPATRLVMHVARRVGEMVAMCLKHAFRVPRPSQLCPAIVPMIDPPATPSFPSSHALQSHLISKCLLQAREGVPGKQPGRAVPQSDRLLEDLAGRVAENRVIAGVHYPDDSKGGELAATRCFDRLMQGTGFKELIAVARAEFLPEKAAGPTLSAFASKVSWGSEYKP